MRLTNYESSNPQPQGSGPGPAGKTFCPYCKSDIRDDLLRCPHCAVDLVRGPAPRITFGTIMGAAALAQVSGGLLLLLVLALFGNAFFL